MSSVDRASAPAAKRGPKPQSPKTDSRPLISGVTEVMRGGELVHNQLISTNLSAVTVGQEHGNRKQNNNNPHTWNQHDATSHQEVTFSVQKHKPAADLIKLQICHGEKVKGTRGEQQLVTGFPFVSAERKVLWQLVERSRKELIIE